MTGYKLPGEFLISPMAFRTGNLMNGMVNGKTNHLHLRLGEIERLLVNRQTRSVARHYKQNSMDLSFVLIMASPYIIKLSRRTGKMFLK